MSYIQRKKVDVTTDAAGDAVVYSEQLNGELCNIIYVKDDSTPFADGVDFAVSLERSAQPVWTESDVNASKDIAPRQQVSDIAGIGLVASATGAPLIDRFQSGDDRFKFVISNGGDTKTGQFILIIR